MAKPHLTINVHIKNERQEGKACSGGTSGRGRVNGEGEGGKLWQMYFVFMHKNRIIKTVEIVLRRGKVG
jgi:hypothetical protein